MKKNQHGTLGLSLIVALCVLGACLVGLVSLYGYANGLRTESVNRETQLNAQYLDNQNYLSAYVSGFYEKYQFIKYKSEKLDQILVNYANARAGGEAPNHAALVNAVVEAVPDLGKTGLDIADSMMAYVESQREGFRQMQSKLLDMLRGYDRWRNDGYVQSWVIEHMIGVPTQRLEARIGDKVLTGKDARNKMYQIVLANEAKQAYESGTMDPLSLPSDKK